MPRFLAVFAITASLTACAAAPPDCDPSAPLGPNQIQVVAHGWHTDLALPASGLGGGLAAFRRIFPGLAVLVIGFGKRTFMVAPAKSLADYLVGPFPGDAALLVTGLKAAPPRAYPDGTVATLTLDAASRARLDAFVWDGFAKDEAGRIEKIAPGVFPGSVFYAARHIYSGVYTCNSWTARALDAAGVAVDPHVIFAGPLMAELAPRSAPALCRIGPGGSP